MAEAKLSVGQAEQIKDAEPVSRATKLHELYERLGDVICFTPAILVVVGKLPVDPVREFVARFPAANKDDRPFCLALPPTAPPFFNGLGATDLNGELIDWDRRLYGISRAGAENCFSFLGGVGVYGADYFASAAEHEIQLPDPLSLFVRKTIPVRVFGVLSGDSIFYLAEHPTGQPYLSRTEAAPHVSNFKLNPYSSEIKQTLEDTL